MNKIVNYISNNKIKTGLLISSISLFGYFIRNNYKQIIDYTKKIYNFYQQTSNLNKNTIYQKNLDINIEKNKNELIVGNISKIKIYIHDFLEKELKINDTKLKLKEQDEKYIYEKFKTFRDKEIIHFYCDIILLKYNCLFSLTSLCLLSVLKNYKIDNIIQNFDSNFYNNLLEELWTIANKTTKILYNNIKDIILNFLGPVSINEKYTKDKFSTLIKDIMSNIKDKFNIVKYISDVMEKYMNNIENQYFDPYSKENNIISFKLKFLYLLNDILFSNLFYSTFIESCVKEINSQADQISCSIGENGKGFIQVIQFLDTHRCSQISLCKGLENNKDINKEENISDEIFINYQNCLLSIDL